MSRDVWSVLPADVLDVIHAHVMSSHATEVGGFIVGTHGEAGPPECVAAIEARDAVGDLTRLTFTHDAWEHVHRVIEERYPHCSIVGWYHSHPGHGVFFSEHDAFIHRNFFPAPWHIAVVVDPVSGSEGLFQWDGDTIELAAERPLDTQPSGVAAVTGDVLPGTDERLVVRVDDEDGPAAAVAPPQREAPPGAASANAISDGPSCASAAGIGPGLGSGRRRELPDPAPGPGIP